MLEEPEMRKKFVKVVAGQHPIHLESQINDCIEEYSSNYEAIDIKYSSCFNDIISDFRGTHLSALIIFERKF
ncbi:MAG: hypothetical protein LBH40_03135 [Alphaproteobacteria bacterium]|jgi:hypothetical protein|nr:hypothetical protein [Alphaproteobacteria bacterium]